MIDKIKKMMTNQTDNPVKEEKTKKSKSSKTNELLKEIETLKLELDEAKDKYLRLYAEFDNYKKRTIKERLDLMKTASQEMMVSLLPILDDFDRAKKSSDEGNEVFSEGVSMIYNKLFSTCEQKGLKQMESTGDLFDAEKFEAITNIPAPSEDMKGKVIDTIEKGYYLHDKIIRHAKVVVAE